MATVPVINHTECKKAYPDEIYDSMFCAGFLDVGGVDSCDGEETFNQSNLLQGAVDYV